MSSMFLIVLVPLLLWSWKKNQSYKIDTEGRKVLNYQITMTIALFTSFFLLMIIPVVLAFLGNAGFDPTDGGSLFMLLVLCGTAPFLLIGMFSFYQGTINTLRSLSGNPVRYPLSIQFLK